MILVKKVSGYVNSWRYDQFFFFIGGEGAKKFQHKSNILILTNSFSFLIFLNIPNYKVNQTDSIYSRPFDIMLTVVY